MDEIRLLPAYGRDYRSIPKVIEALAANKDFILQRFSEGGTYVNLQGLEDCLDSATVIVRYDRQMKQTAFSLGRARKAALKLAEETRDET